jgi:3-deoxy-D-manno-octulosonic acid (KDO) 8-phosphate synthase
MRQQASRQHKGSIDAQAAPNLDYLDIPAFLRRQAD